MQKFIVVHTYKYGGPDAYLIESNSTSEGLENNINSVCDTLGIHYTGSDDEDVSIHAVAEPQSVIL